MVEYRDGAERGRRRRRAGRCEGQAPEAVSTVARALVEALDCAVVAMRYSVEDEFAMAYARNVYDGLFRQGQSLPQATQIASAQPWAAAAAPERSRWRPLRFSA